jgi:hypothetical protein
MVEALCLSLSSSKAPFVVATEPEDLEDGQRELVDDNNVIEGQKEKRDRMTKSTQQVSIR